MNVWLHLYLTFAHSPPIFTAVMTTYYCTIIEEAFRRVKRAVKVAYPGWLPETVRGRRDASPDYKSMHPLFNLDTDQYKP